jgi:putative endonuclease
LLASKPYGTLYIGVACDVARRVREHETKTVDGFTARYGVDRLVWFEMDASAEAVIRREEQIKEWRHDWKINLIERDNPQWIDLYTSLSA